MLKKLTLTLLLAVAGCAGTLPPSPPMDTGPVVQGSAPLTTTTGAPVTGRDWNCAACYK
jgi:hypothetical protein